jgi:hypothetical protein
VRPADGPRRFRFRHPLVRRAVYDASPPGWRLGAHERAAAALAARGAPPAAQAYHVARCARPGDDGAIALLVAAADGTLRTAPAAAARTYAAARALVPEPDAATAAELDHRRAMALAASGHVEEAVELSAQALERGALPPGVTTLQAAEELCGLEGVAGRIERARARVQAYLRDLPPGTPPADTAGLEYVAAMYAFPDAEEALGHGRRALRAVAGRSDLVVAGVHCAVALGAHAAGDPDTADRHQRDAEALLAAASDAETMRRLGALATAGLLGVAREQVAATQELLARAALLAAASAQAHWTGPIGSERAGVLVEAGRPGEARLVAEEAEDVARAGGQRAVLAAVLGHQAVCDLLADRPLDARARITEATAVARGVTRHPLTNGARASLVAAELDGDPERLRAALLSGPPVAAATAPTWRVWRLGALVAAEVALGRAAAAGSLLAEMAALAERHRLPAGHARALLAQARVRGAHDDAPAAAALAAQAAAGAHAAGAVLEAHAAELVRGTALAAAARATTRCGCCAASSRTPRGPGSCARGPRPPASCAGSATGPRPRAAAPPPRPPCRRATS